MNRGIIQTSSRSQSIESASRELISELPSLAKGQAIISGLAINTPTLLRIRKRLTSDARRRNAPALWAAQRKYEEKHPASEVRAREHVIMRNIIGCFRSENGAENYQYIYLIALVSSILSKSYHTNINLFLKLAFPIPHYSHGAKIFHRECSIRKIPERG